MTRKARKQEGTELLGGIGGILAIIFFVTAHEFGHFLAAKAVGIKATEFFFGFGPSCGRSAGARPSTG